MGYEVANGRALGRGETGPLNGCEIGFGPGGRFIYPQSMNHCLNKLVVSTAGKRFAFI